MQKCKGVAAFLALKLLFFSCDEFLSSILQKKVLLFAVVVVVCFRVSVVV